MTGSPELVVSLPGPLWNLDVVTLSGAVAGSVHPKDADGIIGVTPHHIFEVSGSQLLFYGVTGSLLATEPFSQQGLSSQPVFNASATEWVWSTSTTHDLGNTSTPWETTIFEGTMAQPMRTLATHLDPNGERLVPLAIVGNTVYLADTSELGGVEMIPGPGLSISPHTIWHSCDPRVGWRTSTATVPCSASSSRPLKAGRHPLSSITPTAAR